MLGLGKLLLLVVYTMIIEGVVGYEFDMEFVLKDRKGGNLYRAMAHDGARTAVAVYALDSLDSPAKLVDVVHPDSGGVLHFDLPAGGGGGDGGGSGNEYRLDVRSQDLLFGVSPQLRVWLEGDEAGGKGKVAVQQHVPGVHESLRRGLPRTEAAVGGLVSVEGAVFGVGVRRNQYAAGAGPSLWGSVVASVPVLGAVWANPWLRYAAVAVGAVAVLPLVLQWLDPDFADRLVAQQAAQAAQAAAGAGTSHR